MKFKTNLIFLLITLVLPFKGYANQWETSYVDTIPLNSKEFKISLRPELFSRDVGTIDKYREVVEKLLAKNLNKSYLGKKRNKSKTRLVSFFDTKGSCILKNNGYSLRERRATEVGERWINVKYRNRDIEESGNRPIEDLQKRGTHKFEEDIVGVDSIYSHSNKMEIEEDFDISRDALLVYPHLSRSGLQPSHKLVKVGNYTAHEYNYVLGRARFDKRFDKNNKRTKKYKKQSLRAIELTLWFLDGSKHPIVAEVTWKVKDKNGKYHKQNLLNANSFFNRLKRLEYWVDPNPESKTLMIYAHSLGFCNSSAKKSSKQETNILNLTEKIQVNKKGHAHIRTEVLLKGSKGERILLPINFKEAKNIKSNLKAEAIRINGVWYMALVLNGSGSIWYEYDVYRFMDWRIGLDQDGFPNPLVGHHKNVVVKHKFTNTSVHKINTYQLEVKVPPGYEISRILSVAPKKIRKVDPDRFVISKETVRLGFSQSDANDETQVFSLKTGQYAGISINVKPAEK
ncbi:MAG: hypothetical protein HON90_15965, partial [Halobacteriovoraceae bacterium]|nr:hypothetical protein [Halobacteriovoraceae bacterium]